MKMLNPLILLTLIFMVFSVNADSKTNEVKGEATIVVDNKTYTLAFKKYFSGNNTEDGKTHEAFVMLNASGRKSKGTEPKFTATGSKTDKTGYSLEVGGGF